MYCTTKFVYVMFLQLSLELLSRDILRMIFHIDFKCGSTNFQKHQQVEEVASKI